MSVIMFLFVPMTQITLNPLPTVCPPLLVAPHCWSALTYAWHSPHVHHVYLLLSTFAHLLNCLSHHHHLLSCNYTNRNEH